MNQQIRIVALSSFTVTTLAGGGSVGGAASGYLNGVGTNALFSYPVYAEADGRGSVFVSDGIGGNSLLRVVDLASGLVGTFAGGGGSNAYGYADGVGTAALLNHPAWFTIDRGARKLYFAEPSNQAIRVVDLTTKMVGVLAGSPGRSGLVDGSGGAAARFVAPVGVSAIINGQLLVTDGDNSNVRAISVHPPSPSLSPSLTTSPSVSASPTLSTTHSPVPSPGTFNFVGTVVAATTNGSLEGIAVDASSGRLYVADAGSNAIRVLNRTSDHSAASLSILAGGVQAGSTDGTGTAARFRSPSDVAPDGFGLLYVADSNNSCIRSIVLSTAVVTTFAGRCGVGGNADGVGTVAAFMYPRSIALDGLGNM